MSSYTGPFYGKVPVEAALDSRLNATHFRVLIVLLSFQGNKSYANPTREMIAERCRINLRMVSRATEELQNFGWLEKTGGGGRGKPAQYKIKIPSHLLNLNPVQPDTDTSYNPVQPDTLTLSVQTGFNPLNPVQPGQGFAPPSSIRLNKKINKIKTPPPVDNSAINVKMPPFSFREIVATLRGNEEV